MPSLVREARVTKRLLGWPLRVSGTIQSLFTKQFWKRLELCQYLSKDIFKTDTFHLMITLDCFEYLQNDPVFYFPQIQYIFVICDTIDDANEMQIRVTPITDKVKFYTIDDLLKWPREPELDLIFGSSNPIDQNTKEAILSLNKDRLDHAKRIICNRLSPALIQLTTNPIHGLPVKNADNFTSNFICQLCELVNQQMYKLECSHYLCEGCLIIRERCAICRTTISQNEILPNSDLQKKELLSISADCFGCEWKGKFKKYPEHFKQNHIDLSTCLIGKQQVNENAVGDEIPPDNFSSINSNVSNSSLNGICIWKISDMNQILNKAISGEMKSIYSSPFYLYPHGYKVCFRLFVNGDLKGRNTHMSMFLAIMRGKYDADLRWPFSLKVTFSLIDQSIEHDKKHHLSQFCWPDKDEKCSGRPISKMNLQYGIPQCFSLDEFKQKLDKFIHNDTMFIKIQFEISTEIPTNDFSEKPNEEMHTDEPENDWNHILAL
ncbi:unnamed protein product [Adineta steineri]|uniref:Uncharacterized protein n=1 Tax=Adineta steineri TaxID=433720 RepID=A0A818RE13_9BILA|nr:unnamed protein product [Adineta steineri]